MRGNEKDLVTSVVTKSIVDVLEPIQVDVQHTDIGDGLSTWSKTECTCQLLRE